MSKNGRHNVENGHNLSGLTWLSHMLLFVVSTIQRGEKIMKKKLMLNELEIQSFLTKEGGKTESHAQFAEKIVAGACSYPNYCPFPCSNHPICE